MAKTTAEDSIDAEELRFRVADEADVDSMADAHRDSIRSLGAKHYPPAVIEEWVDVVDGGLYLQAMHRGEVFFIATTTTGSNGLKVLGFASDYRIDGTLHGTSVYVRGSAARRGIGSRLLRMAEAFGRSRGATAVQIESSLGAVEFYRANGFAETGSGDIGLPSGFRMACVFMHKEL
jgi:GNAT superfamily N-acetyltransferase